MHRVQAHETGGKKERNDIERFGLFLLCKQRPSPSVPYLPHSLSASRLGRFFQPATRSPPAKCSPQLLLISSWACVQLSSMVGPTFPPCRPSACQPFLPFTSPYFHSELGRLLLGGLTLASSTNTQFLSILFSSPPPCGSILVAQIQTLQHLLATKCKEP